MLGARAAGRELAGEGGGGPILGQAFQAGRGHLARRGRIEASIVETHPDRRQKGPARRGQILDCDNNLSGRCRHQCGRHQSQGGGQRSVEPRL